MVNGFVCPKKTSRQCGDLSGNRPLMHGGLEIVMNDEIPTVPPGSIASEQDGHDVFLLLHGKRIAKRGHPGTRKAKKWIPKAKKWIPIVPWIASVSDETDSSVTIRYARDQVGRA